MKWKLHPLAYSILTCILITVSYSVLGKVGLQFASIHPSISAIWPPTGLAIASLLVFGLPMWPAIAIGAFIVNITTIPHIPASLGIAAGNTLEAVISVLLVRRFAGGLNAFDRPRSTVLYVLWAGVIATLVSALIGVTVMLFFHIIPRSLFYTAFLTWWMGDMGGAILISPLILLWTLNPKITLSRTKTPEFLALLGLLIGICWLVYSSMLPFPYLFFLPVLWSAFSFGLRETMTVIFFISVLSVWITASGNGPFVDIAKGSGTSLWYLQMFLIVLTLTKLMVASLVSDRKRTNDELTLRERFYKALTEKNTDAVCLIDTSGLLTYVSPSSYAVLGYTPEEAIGKSSISFIHPDEQKTATQLLTSLVTKPQEIISHVYRMRSKDGSYKWIETIGRSLLSDPAVHAIIVNFRDVTERKALEEAKNDFFMIAAHQLRSPLTSIRWHIESVLSKKSDFPSDLKQKLDRIYLSSQVMIRTVNEVLEVTRIIEGKLGSNPEQTAIIPIIKSVFPTVDHMANAHHTTLLFEEVGHTPPVFVDPKLFSEVYENILSNAVKYTISGTVSTSVTHTDTTVTVTVSDTGIGIPKSDQEGLFTKFFRTKEARSIDAEGAGLGLFIASSFVHSWGGTIRVVSPTIGTTGTSVEFTIPLKPNTFPVRKGAV